MVAAAEQMRYEVQVCVTHQDFLDDPYWEDHDGYPLLGDEAPCVYAWVKVHGRDRDGMDRWLESMFVCALHGKVQGSVPVAYTTNQMRDEYARGHVAHVERAIKDGHSLAFQPWHPSHTVRGQKQREEYANGTIRSTAANQGLRIGEPVAINSMGMIASTNDTNSPAIGHVVRVEPNGVVVVAMNV